MSITYLYSILLLELHTAIMSQLTDQSADSKRFCAGKTKKGNSCKRWVYGDAPTQYMCPSHSGKPVDVSPLQKRCIGKTAKNVRCSIHGIIHKVFKYTPKVDLDSNYMCPKHFKQLVLAHPNNYQDQINRIIQDLTYDETTIEMSDTSSSDSDLSESSDVEFSTVPSVSRPKTTKSHKSTKSDYAGWSYKEPVRSTQKPTRCVGVVVRKATHGTGTYTGRCAKTGMTDEVYRCNLHTESHLDYGRCTGITNDQFKCIRVGVPQNDSNTFRCHQHHKK